MARGGPAGRHEVRGGIREPGTDGEVLFGTDQGHLSFRVSVLREPERVVLGTVVPVPNRRGRL